MRLKVKSRHEPQESKEVLAWPELPRFRLLFFPKTGLKGRCPCPGSKKGRKVEAAMSMESTLGRRRSQMDLEALFLWGGGGN